MKRNIDNTWKSPTISVARSTVKQNDKARKNKDKINNSVDKNKISSMEIAPIFNAYLY